MTIPFSFVGPEIADAGGSYPTAAQVLDGVVFGPSDNLTGTVVLPAVGDVQESVTFGASSALVGTLELPTAAQVLDGIGFGAGGTEFEGTLDASGSGVVFAGDGYFATDWALCEGIEDLGYVFGPDREFEGDTPTTKTSGIKGRRGNPTQKQIAYANGAGVQVPATDQVWTIWESTFRADGEDVLVMPAAGDKIQVLEVDSNGDPVTPLNVLETWVVRYARRVLYGAQYLCYCYESASDADKVY